MILFDSSGIRIFLEHAWVYGPVLKLEASLKAILHFSYPGNMRFQEKPALHSVAVPLTLGRF